MSLISRVKISEKSSESSAEILRLECGWGIYFHTYPATVTLSLGIYISHPQCLCQCGFSSGIAIHRKEGSFRGRKIFVRKEAFK